MNAWKPDFPEGFEFKSALQRRRRRTVHGMNGEVLMQTYHSQCTVCKEWIELDERGDVLDASGRCSTCAP